MIDKEEKAFDYIDMKYVLSFIEHFYFLDWYTGEFGKCDRIEISPSKRGINLYMLARELDRKGDEILIKTFVSFRAIRLNRSKILQFAEEFHKKIIQKLYKIYQKDREANNER